MSQRLPAPVRQARILRSVGADGSCSVTRLAHELDVSCETVRRDIRALAGKGLLERVHGGAVVNDLVQEPAFRRRLATNADAKRAMAQAVAARIADHSSLMVDTGSTTLYVARALQEHRGLTVVTNGIEIARTLARGVGNRIFVVGGELRPDDGALLGGTAGEVMARFRAQFAILSIAAIDLHSGLMDFHPREAEFAQAVMHRAERTIVVADRSKFGAHAPVEVAGFGDIDTLITDRAPPKPFAGRLREAGVQVVIARRKRDPAHAGGHGDQRDKPGGL
jgi:DeoR family transcriptional regulator, glycerol-3-phosphate regulon repressor